MGAQHDFTFVIPTQALKVSVGELEALMEEDEVLKDDLGYEIIGTPEGIEVSFSFYSSYSHLNEVEQRMKDLLKKVVEPGTEIQNNYEVTSIETETFVI